MSNKLRTSSITATTSSGYIPSLDGWRAIAIVAVILFHCRVIRWGVISDAWVHAVGVRGVDLFFTLSGFLICGRLLREESRDDRVPLRAFYMRRIFRIQPVALTYLAVVSVLILCGEIYRLDHYPDSPWPAVVTSLLMLTNVVRRNFLFETAHFWSLSVEEQFYVFLPTFLILCKRYRLAALTAILIAANIWRVKYLSTPHPAQVFQRTDLACSAILAGCIVALLLARPRFHGFASAYLRPSIALSYATLIFIATTVHHSRAEYPLLISTYPILIVATALHSQSWTTRFLELAPMRFVGRISYSLYLWQELFFDPFAPPPPHSFRSHLLLCWIGTFACAVASYYVIERPMIRYGQRVVSKFESNKQLQTDSIGSAEIPSVA